MSLGYLELETIRKKVCRMIRKTYSVLSSAIRRVLPASDSVFKSSRTSIEWWGRRFVATRWHYSVDAPATFFAEIREFIMHARSVRRFFPI